MVFIEPTSVTGSLCAYTGTEGTNSVDSTVSFVLNSNSVQSTSENQFSFYNSDSFVCPDDISTYTDINSCTSLISSGLDIEDPENLLMQLSWEMDGATVDSSPTTGINQIGTYAFNEGTTFIGYTGTDKNNAPVSCSFTVLVSDNQVPRVENPSGNIEVSSEKGECNARVSWPEPIVSDNCTPADQILVSANHYPGNSFPVGATEVIYNINDGMEYNNVELRFTVTVTDDEPPFVTTPLSVTVECGNPVPDAFTNWQQFEAAGGAVHDNCNVDYTTFRYVSQTRSSSFCPYILTRKYHISDVHGNVAEVDHQITVVEEEEEAVEEEITVESEPVLILKSATAEITAVATGNWSDPNTWSTGIVPTAADNVTIPNGYTVTIDVTNATCDDITINSGGGVSISGSNKIEVNGNWTNNGTFNAGTSGIVEFGGTGNITISGTTTFEDLIISKNDLNALVNISGTTTVSSGGDLTLNGGLISIGSGASVALNFSSTLTIPSTAGFDVTGGTLTTGNFTITNEGLIRVSSGTANFGTNSGNEVHTQTDGAFIVSGGTVNIAGRLYNSAAGTLNPPSVTSGISISGGTVTLCTVGNGLSNTGSLNVTSAGNFNFPGGTIVFQNPSTATTELDLGLLSGTGTKNTSGGTFQFGNSSTPAGSTFNISSGITLDNVTSSSNADLVLESDVFINQMTLNSATTIDLNGNSLQLGATGTGTYNFPIEDGSGNAVPVSVNLTSGSGFGAGDYIEVTTTDSKHANNTSSSHYLNQYWTIDVVGIFGSVYNISATYQNSDISGTESEIAGGVWTNSLLWTKLGVTASGSNTISATGITNPKVDFTGITLDDPTVVINSGNASEEICLGASGVTLTAVPTGDPGWTYSWNPATGLSASNIASPTANPTSTTTYTVTVTDGNGFTATDDIQVIVNSLPVVTFNLPSGVCEDEDAFMLTGGSPAGGTYSGSGVSSGEFNPALAGVGTHTITYDYSDFNSCSGSVSETITVYDIPTVKITVGTSGSTICEGVYVEFTTTVTGAGTSPTFQWETSSDGGSTWSDISGEQADNYNSSSLVNGQLIRVVMTAEPSHCNSVITSNAYTMTVNPEVIPSVTILESDDDICEGESVTFSATIINPGANPSYQWEERNGGSWSSIAGETGQSYITSGLQDGDEIRVTIISDATCASPTSATSNTVSISVNPVLIPDVTVTATQITICPGETIDFTATPTNEGTNPFYQWQVNGVNVGTDLPTYSSASLNDGDQVAVVLTSSIACPSPAQVTSTALDITVEPGTPSIPDAITGDANVCPGETKVYSIASVTDATTYTWTVPSASGWTIDSGQGTETIIVTTGNEGTSGNITVTATNSCGTSAERITAVSVGALSVAPTGISNPNNNTCESVSKTLTVSGGSMGTGAEWIWYTGSCGGTQVGTGTSITVTPVAGTTTTYYVRAEGTCNTTACASADIIVNPAAPAQPGLITGVTPLCPGESATFSISSVADASSYAWSVPGGWSINSGQGSTSITVTIGSVGDDGNISVTASNSCGTSSASTLGVVVEPGEPDTPGEISGDEMICSGSSVSYSIDAVSDATTYNWTLPAGWSITAGQNTNSITVSTAGSPGDVTLQVTAENSCGVSAANSKTITIVDAVPSQPGTIDGLTGICPTRSTYYSISAVSGADYYTWVIPEGWNIDAGQGTTELTGTITSFAESGDVKVVAENVCGPSDTTYLAVTIDNNGTVYAGDDIYVCEGTTVVTMQGQIGGVVDGANDWDWVYSSGTMDDESSLYSLYYLPSGFTTGDIYIAIEANNKKISCDGTITDSMMITVLPSPTATFLATDTVCEGENGTVVIEATPNTTIDYRIGTGIPQIVSVDDSGVATLITDALYADATYNLIRVSYDEPSICYQILTETVDVVVNSPIVVDAGGDQSVCTSSPDVTLAGTITGDVTTGTWSGYNGTFNTNENELNAIYTPSASEIAAGVLTLTLTSDDPAGPCGVVSDQVTITFDQAATINAGSDLEMCSDGTVTLAGSYGGAATSASWSGGAGIYSPDANTISAEYTPSAAEITNGSVEFILTTDDPAGVCDVVSDTVLLTIYPAAVSNAGIDQTICASSTVSLTGAVSGGATSGIWSGGNGVFDDNTSLSTIYTPSADEITDGTVTLTLTTDNPAGPCFSTSDLIVITIDPAATVNAGIDANVCEGSDIILDGSIGGAASSATWSGGSGTFSPDASTLNATYTPSASDITVGTIELILISEAPSNTCGAVSDTMLLTIDPTISVSAGNDTMICSDASITLNGFVESGYTATWSSDGSGSFDNTSLANATYTPGNGDVLTGTVTLTFTTEDPAGVCNPVSDELILTVKDSITITTQPVNTGVCSSESADIFVEAVGSDLTYQWYNNGGTAVTNTTNISGAQTSTLHFNNATSVDMGNYYVVISSPTFCDSKISNMVTLNVDEEINIITPLDSDSLCVGESLTFHIVAEPGGVLDYQWRKDGVDISGETGSTFTLTDLMVADSGVYTVHMTGVTGYTCSEKESLPGYLVVIDNASITPDDQAEAFCLNAPVDTVVYAIDGGVDDISITSGSLPSGLSGLYDEDEKSYIITGTPTVSGIYSFTITASGMCLPAEATGTITIQDELLAGVISGSQDICYNAVPADLSLTTSSSGGSGTFAYQWQDSISGGNWNDIFEETVTTLSLATHIDTVYYRLVVTDSGALSCGTVISNEVAINPSDVTPPSFTVPADVILTADGSCDANTDPGLTGEISATSYSDNCASLTYLQVNTTWSDHDTVPGSCGSSIQFTRTWTVTDEAGNSTSLDQLISIEDVTAPVFTLIPSDNAYSCVQDTSPASLGFATADDVCDSSVDITYFDVVTPGTCNGSYSFVRNWVATDDCGNADTATTSYIITDNVAPLVIDNGDTVISCPIDIPDATTYGMSFLDECGLVLDVELTDEIAYGLDGVSGYCPYQVVRTWEVTDDCYNITEFTQTIGILQDASCDDCSECLYDNTFYVADLRGDPDGDTTFYNVVKRDKCCGAENEPGSQTLFCASFNVILDEGAVGVEILIDKVTPSGQDWKVDCEDVDGGDIVCLPSGEYHLFTFCKNAASDQPQDNDYTFRSVAGVIASGDIETREECDEVLQVTGDFENPRWTSIYPGNEGDYDYLLSSTTDTIVYFNAEPGVPPLIQYAVCGDISATICATTTGGVICDTVDVYVHEAISVDLNINPDQICEDYIPTVTPSIYPAGAYDLEWYVGATPSGTPAHTGDSYTPLSSGWFSVVAIDNTTGIACNRDTFSFEMLYDHTGPTVKEPPAPLEIYCNDANAAQQIQDWLDLASATYINADGDTVPATITNDYTGITMECGYVDTVVFTAFDNCSNDSTAFSYITVLDETPPVISPEAQDENVECSTFNPEDQPEYLTWLANYGGALASDECDLDLTWTTDTATAVWESGSNRDSITVTFTVTDDCGNSSSTTAIFTISDDTPPEITSCPSDVEAIVDAASCSITGIPMDTVAYEDLCSVPDLLWEMTGATIGTGTGQVTNETFYIGITTVIFTVIDDAGLTDTCSFQVWAKHEDFPTANITCPADTVRADAEADCYATVDLDALTYIDPCNEIDSVWNNSPYGNSPADADGDYPIGTTDFTWYITDVSGNIDSCNVTVIIGDVDAPQFTYCPSGPFEDVIPADSCYISTLTLDEPTWTESCGATLTYILSGATTGSGMGLVNGISFNVGQTTVTYVLTDSGNNTATCEFVVWVKHLDVPTANFTCPVDTVRADADADCYATVDLDPLTYIDPCNEIDSVWNNSPYGNSSADADGDYPIGTTDFTWYITDVSGNIDSCNVTVIIGDVDAPQFTYCPSGPFEDVIPADSCSISTLTLDEPTWTEPCGATLTYILSGATTGSGTGLVNGVSFNIGQTTVTYVLTDSGNNTDTCEFDVIVKHIEIPDAAFSCPTPSYVEQDVDPGSCDAYVALDSIEIIDPCNEIDRYWNNSLYRTTETNASGTYPVGSTVFNWYILDIFGSLDSCQVEVLVNDTIPPALADLTPIIECYGYSIPAGDSQLDIDSLWITDNCDLVCNFDEYEIRWRIDYSDGTSVPSGSGTFNTGQISEYGTEILFPDDDVNHTDNLEHIITYWIVDCAGNVSESKTRTVTIYPEPLAVAPADTLSYCYGDYVAPILLTGQPSNVVFDVSGGTTVGIADLTGVTEIPELWATQIDTATITITPRANGCVGEPISFTFAVKSPVMVAVNPAFETICSEEITNINLSSSNLAAVFSWTISSIVPSGSVSGASDGTGDYIGQTLVNTTSDPGVVTYTVTGVANGCTSPGTIDVEVTVNPLPELIITDPDTVCEPETIDLTDATIVAGSSSNLTYSYWTDLSATTAVADLTAVAVSGTYYIQAVTAEGCSAIDSVNVQINPLPELTSELTPSGICSNDAFTYTPTSNVPGTVFTWTRAEVAGISNPAETGTGSINEYLENTTNSPIAVTYEYTLIVNGCSSTEQVVVMVTPIPELTSSQTPSAICSGELFSYTPTSNISGTDFPWTRAAVDGISNAAASGTGDPNEILINTTSNPIGVVYEYTLSSNDCGNPETYQVYVVVVPSPEVSVSASETEICPDESVDLFSTSDVLSTTDPVLLSEDFNSAASGSTSGPNGWTTVNNSNNGTPANAAWTVRPDNYNNGRIFSSNDNSNFYLSDSDSQGGGSTTSTQLISPAMSTVGYSDLELEFYHYYRSHASVAYVEVSTDGTNWATVHPYYGGDGESTSFSYETISLNGYIGLSQLYVRFRYEANWGWYWAIDNVTISGTPTQEAEVTWTSIPEGFTSTEANPTDVYPKETTIYIATYTDPDTNCPGSDSVTVIVREEPDVTIMADYCIVPPKIRLTASGGYSSYSWSTGETSEYIDVDIASIFFVTVTDAYGCTGIASYNTANELVVNGSFESGNTGFSSDYGFRAPWVTPPDEATNSSNSALWDENYYGVGTDARYYHSNFWGNDHTSGSGNFMIVNGNTNAGSSVWEQDVEVETNTNYYFSAWAMSLNSAGNDAVLQFEVNGELVGTQAALPAGESNYSNDGWVRFYSDPLWNSGSVSGTITIRIRNVEPAANGNDFGLDDISFGTLDPAPATVDAISLSGSSVCEGDSINLIMVIDGGKDPYTYSWSGPDGFTVVDTSASIVNAGLAAAGDYIATITDGYGCGPVSDTVTVDVDPAALVDAGPDQEVCATSPDVLLAGSYGGSATSATWWTSGSGTISSLTAVDATYTLSDSDTTAGVVTLALTTNDPGTSCGPVSDTMNIFINPAVIVEIDTAVNPLCPGSSDGYITAIASGGTAPYTWEWNTSPVQTSATASNLAAGTYTVTVTDAKGCTAVTSATVSDPPELVVDGVLTTDVSCYNGDDGEAIVVISSGDNPSFSWSNGSDSIRAVNLTAGIYSVMVTAENGCSALTLPVAISQPAAPTLSCPPDTILFADFGEIYASNVGVEMPEYLNDCPLVDQVWEMTGATIDSSASVGIDTLEVHDFNLGVTTITYTFRDFVGNENICSFTVTVLGAPDIECPPNDTLYSPATTCDVTFDPGVPTLLEGVPPITWEYILTNPDGTTVSDTYTKDAPDKYPDPFGDYDFVMGLTTIDWVATNEAGTDSCGHTILVLDTVPPTITTAPYEDCVDPLEWAVYNLTNPTPVYNHIDPMVEKSPVDYRTMYAGDTFLDVTALTDNCCDSTDITLNWRIDFSPTPDPDTGADVNYPSISGMGQPATYVNPVTLVPEDIYLYGDGVTYTTITHTITYWAEDCNGNMSEEVTEQIIITPRPQIVKEN